MSSGRRLHEIIKDADVSIQAAKRIEALSKLLADRASDIRRRVSEDLAEVRMEGAMESIDASDAQDDPEAVQISYDVVAELLDAVGFGLPATVVPVVPVVDDPESVVHLPKGGGKEPTFVFHDIVIPASGRDLAETIMNEARMAALQPVPAFNPRAGSTGRHHWRLKLFLKIEEETRAELLAARGSGSGSNLRLMPPAPVLPAPSPKTISSDPAPSVAPLVVAEEPVRLPDASKVEPGQPPGTAPAEVEAVDQPPRRQASKPKAGMVQSELGFSPPPGDRAMARSAGGIPNGIPTGRPAGGIPTGAPSTRRPNAREGGIPEKRGPGSTPGERFRDGDRSYGEEGRT